MSLLAVDRKTKMIALRLSSRDMRALRRIADKTNTKVAAIVRECVVEHLNALKKKP